MKSKIYKFDDYLAPREEYLNRIKQSIVCLDNIDDLLTKEMIEIAVTDKWKKWNEEQAEGTIFNFQDEMLSQTGDKSVDIIYLLRENLRDSMEKIKELNKINERR
jgi:hypothetical protein